jgi:hypothetical protein
MENSKWFRDSLLHSFLCAVLFTKKICYKKQVWDDTKPLLRKHKAQRESSTTGGNGEGVRHIRDCLAAVVKES